MSDEETAAAEKPAGALRRLLILGGTAEARALADLAAERFGARLEIIVSLAGRTLAPAAYAGVIRVGGFGGADGLAAYLRNEKIDLLVDATHPFAAAISSHAVAAAAQTGVALLRLQRPEWRPGPGDRWIEVADADDAARAAAGLGRRIFLSFGGRELAAFSTLRDRWFLVRRVETPDGPLPLHDYALTLGRGPFTVEGETDLLRRHRVNVVVAKASGGGTRAKLDAARALGLPVVLIARPSAPAALTVASSEEAVRRIGAALFRDTAIDGATAVSA
jgi:precorrin-6A/cobalt-precorrin-6A reductase